MRAGLCSVALRALAVDEVIAVCERAGLEGIEWGADVHVPPGDEVAASRAARRCALAGLACPSYGSYLFAGALDPEAVTPVLDSAGTLGVGSVRIWCAWGSDTDPSVRPRVVDEVAAVAAAAAERDLAVTLEWHQHTLTADPAATQELLAEVGAANLFTSWQPLEGMEVPALLDGFESVIDDVSHLHVFRWASFEERWPLAAGEDLWPAVLARAAAVPGRWGRRGFRFDRWAFIEFVRGDDPEQVVADAATLRPWLLPPPA